MDKNVCMNKPQSTDKLIINIACFIHALRDISPVIITISYAQLSHLFFVITGSIWQCCLISTKRPFCGSFAYVIYQHEEYSSPYANQVCEKSSGRVSISPLKLNDYFYTYDEKNSAK